ncbi:MAG: hypothetical protein U0903_18265 [Planctomycetales bacterium]
MYFGPVRFWKISSCTSHGSQAADSGVIPIFAKAADYGGTFSSVLEKAISPFCNSPAATFLASAKSKGMKSVIILDGLNECFQTDTLLLDTQAFYLKWSIPIVITSQEHTTLSADLNGKTIVACSLSSLERKAILLEYKKGELAQTTVDLCKPFLTPFELSIAATCITEVNGIANQARLFDAYLRASCRGLYDFTVTRRLLSALADVMRTQLRSSLNASEVVTVCESLLREQGLTFSKFSRA